MINNSNSILVTLHVKFWSAYKHDKESSKKTIEDNHMEKGAGKFNKKLIPKFATKNLKDIITQFKYYFTENTLPYNALIGTRILPSSSFIEFQKEILKAQTEINKEVKIFISEYDNYIQNAKYSLGDLFKETDYPPADKISQKFQIIVNFLPVPEPARFNKNITNVQVKRLTAQLTDMSLQAKFDLVNRTEKAARILLDTLERTDKRIHKTTVVDNITKLSEQLIVLNYENDPLIQEIKECVDENILNIRIDYLKESPSYREKIIKKTKNVIKLIEDINDAG